MVEALDRDVAQNAGLQPKSFIQSGGATTAVLPSFTEGLTRPAYLAHVVLNTDNVHVMHDWYGKVLGAHSTFALHRARMADSSGIVSMSDLDFMTFDQEHHRIAFVQRDAAPAKRAINHMAFTYRSIFDLIDAWKRLRAKGIQPHFTIHHGPTVSNYYIDPDGNRVELQVDVFATPAAIADYFASGAFTPDPVGRVFDFADLAARAGAGADYLIANDGFIADHQTAAGTANAPDAAAQPYPANNAKLPHFDDGVARPAYLAHVVLSTNNVERISEWYKDLLGAQSTFAAKGFRATDPYGGHYDVDMDFVTFDDEHHRVAFSRIGGNRNDPPPPRTLNHIAFTYASIRDLVSTYSRLKTLGILPVRILHHGPTISNYYLDPDGNRIELQVDVFGDAESLNGWFSSGVFNINPLGRVFDFDKMVERCEAGDSPAYLLSNHGFIADYEANKL